MITIPIGNRILCALCQFGLEYRFVPGPPGTMLLYLQRRGKWWIFPCWRKAGHFDCVTSRLVIDDYAAAEAIDRKLGKEVTIVFTGNCEGCPCS